jgi:hypothetical protein
VDKSKAENYNNRSNDSGDINNDDTKDSNSSDSNSSNSNSSNSDEGNKAHKCIGQRGSLAPIGGRLKPKYAAKYCL